MKSVSIKDYRRIPDNVTLKCFVCGNKILNRYYFLSTVTCQTSGNKITEILSQLIGEVYYVVVSENDVICRCCTSLLNTYDRLECLRNQLRFIVRKNLNENYLSRQKVDECADYETSQDPLFVKPNLTSSVKNYGESELVTMQSDASALKVEENKSIIQAALESLQFDLKESPSCLEANMTYSFIPSFNNFADSDIDNHISALPDIDISCISDEFPFLPNCNSDNFQCSHFDKANLTGPTNFNCANNSEINHCILTDLKKNILSEPMDDENSKANELCLSGNGKHTSQSSITENFYVQIVKETGETSRSVLTLDSSSAQVIERNWENIEPE